MRLGRPVGLVDDDKIPDGEAEPAMGFTQYRQRGVRGENGEGLGSPSEVAKFPLVRGDGQARNAVGAFGQGSADCDGAAGATGGVPRSDCLGEQGQGGQRHQDTAAGGEMLCDVDRDQGLPGSAGRHDGGPRHAAQGANSSSDGVLLMGAGLEWVDGCGHAGSDSSSRSAPRPG